MNFNTLAWSALCFYYRSAGEKSYSAVMSDHKFLERLRSNPKEVSPREFEEKAVLGLINIQNYDLLIGHKLTENILAKIINLQDELSMLRDLSLIECNLDDERVVEGIKRIYSELHIDGLWITGASKIAHLLNDKLLPTISINIARYFGFQRKTDVMPWLRRMQLDIREASDDFSNQGLKGTPGKYLSYKVGYIKYGYEKSLTKFADEYYWLRYIDELPVPPIWTPNNISIKKAKTSDLSSQK